MMMFRKARQSTFWISQRLCNTDKSGWFDTKLVEIGKISPDTSLFTFELPEEKKDLSVPIGHNFSVRPVPSTDGEVLPVKRSYTPLLQQKDDGTVRLAVKVYEQGPLTQYLSKLKVGDHMQMKGPKGRFDSEEYLFYGPDKTPKTLCMVAGGSGITPLLQIVRAMYYRRSLVQRPTFLLYANRTPADILFKEELDRYVSKYGKFRVQYFVDELGDYPKEDNITEGQFDAEAFQNFFPKAEGESSVMLICGTNSMNQAAKECAEDLNFTAENIFVF